MNREEARLELDATTLRPHDASPEARAQAESDPKLAAWLEQRTAFDESVAAAFQKLPVAPGLRESIINAAYARPKKSTRWVTPTLIAAAACLAFGWTLLWPGSSAMAAWESESLAAVAKVEYGVMKLDEHAATLEALKKLLNATGCPCPVTVPAKLAGLPTYGCKRIRVDGRAATIICFELESGKEAHLVVMSSQNLCDCPAKDTPCFKSAKNWSYASWSHGEQAFILATTADEAALKKLFGLV